MLACRLVESAVHAYVSHHDRQLAHRVVQQAAASFDIWIYPLFEDAMEDAALSIFDQSIHLCVLSKLDTYMYLYRRFIAMQWAMRSA